MFWACRPSTGRAKARRLAQTLYVRRENMTRPVGTANIQPLENRNAIATTATQDIRHLAQQDNDTPREQFKALLRHQRNYLNWIDTRHRELLEAKRQLNPNGRGPKDAVYRKYRWYAQQQSLLEAINGFEVFYKRTFINLGEAIQSYVPPDKVKGTVEARTLWATATPSSTAALIFEHQLFHSLKNIDDLTNLLVGARRYMPDNVNGRFYTRSKALRAIFQIRHTLSHNQGRVTQSDMTKFAVLGYTVVQGEVLDPSSDHLGTVVRDLLTLEVDDFTNWLLDQSANYLSQSATNHGMVLLAAHRDAILNTVGSRPSLIGLPWQ